VKTERLAQARHATTWYLASLELYGEEFEDWDPAALRTQLTEDVPGLPPQAVEKAMAAVALRSNHLFHESVGAFTGICNTLSFGMAMADNFVPAGLEDLSWGVTEAQLIDGVNPAELPFAPAIRRYVGVTLDQHGFYQPPRCLEWADYPRGLQEANQQALAADAALYQVYWDQQKRMNAALQQYLAQRMNGLLQEVRGMEFKVVDQTFLNKLLQQMGVQA
jgi:hypothetical protein